MSKQPEAILLARGLEGDGVPWTRHEVAAELRRLSALNAELVEALEEAEEWVGEYVSQMSSYAVSDRARKTQAKARAVLAKATP